MPAECYEDRLELDLERLEAVPLAPGGAGFSAYPYPWLRLIGGTERGVFRCLILENAALKATFLPDLGGRLVSLFDKRTQLETFPTMRLTEGGPRGVEWPQGLRWQSGPKRLNELGPVEFQIQEPDEDGSATLVLAEYGAGNPIAWHALITLPAEEAELRVEYRATNRSLRPEPYEAPFEVGLPFHFESPEATAFEGLVFWNERGDFGPSMRRFGSGVLGARALDGFGFRMAPLAPLGPVVAASPFGALGVSRSEVRFQAQAPVLGAKLVLRLADGRVLEASADLYPERPFSAEIEGDVVAFAVLGAAREELFRWDRSAPSAPVASEASVVEALLEGHEPDAYALRLMESQPDQRYLANWARACSGDSATALPALEAYLGQNAEDPRAWLLRAIHHRLTGTDSEDALNAHFLAPLDPLLRMESWLAQNAQTKEPSPLVAPLAANPDHFVEGALFLLETGLYEELARWVDECLRHREVPMLRYVLAVALKRRGRMAAEAANNVQRARQTPINPPYPWRDLELAVLRELAGDERVDDLLKMAINVR